MEANMANGRKKSKIRLVKDELKTAAISSKAETPIQKPGKFDLNKFKSKRGATICGDAAGCLASLQHRGGERFCETSP